MTLFSSGGSKIDKITQINDHVKAMFLDVRSHRGIVHDQDLQRWALQKSREVSTFN